jgi:hypothetical protein
MALFWTHSAAQQTSQNCRAGDLIVPMIDKNKGFITKTIKFVPLVMIKQ